MYFDMAKRFRTGRATQNPFLWESSNLGLNGIAGLRST